RLRRGGAGSRGGHRANDLLDLGQRGGADAERPDPEAEQQEDAERVGRELAADADLDAGGAARLGGAAEQLEHGRVERRIQPCDARVAAVDGERVLDQVVRADREKIRVARELGRAQGRGRGLDHDPDLVAGVEGDAGLAKVVLLLLEQTARALDLLDLVDERQHDPDVPVRGGAQESAELLAEEVLEVEAEADRAPPEERILLGRHLEEEGELVPAQVERADVDGLVRERLRDLAVGLVLLLLLGLRATADDEELGAEEADAHRAVRAGDVDLAREVDVGAQQDGLAVRGDGLEMREEDQLLLPLTHADVALAVNALLELRRLDDHAAGPAVQDQLLAVLDDAGDVAEADDGGQADRAGEDGRVGGPAAGVGRVAEHLAPVELHGERRREVARDQQDRLLDA